MSLLKWDYIIGIIASVALAVAGYFNWVPFADIEIAAFITGGWSVWMLVKESMWNWFWGIINGAIFVYIFYDYALYADAAINMWYVIAGIAGVVYWKYGGRNRTVKAIQHISKLELIILPLIIAGITYFMYGHLVALQDTAPFLDALTTAMSIVAFYMQARKIIENWWVWIAADIIYIPLYFSKALPLTGILYILFMAMCFAGLWQWWNTMKDTRVKRPAIMTGQPTPSISITTASE